MGIFVVIMIVGGLSAYLGQDGILMAFMNDYQKAWHISTILYFMGLLIIFLSSSLLKKPEEIQYGKKKNKTPEKNKESIRHLTRNI